MEVFVGTILPAGFNFAPIGWVPCDGRALAISEYEVLYALIGTTYGGNGQTTFNVPDLRGRVPICYGQGPGLPNVPLGQQGGQASITLGVNNLPAHNHLMRVAATGNTNVAANNFLSNITSAGGDDIWGYTDDITTVTAVMNGAAVSAAGGSLPVETMPPYQVVNYMIAAFGIYPSQ